MQNQRLSEIWLGLSSGKINKRKGSSGAFRVRHLATGKTSQCTQMTWASFRTLLWLCVISHTHTHKPTPANEISLLFIQETSNAHLCAHTHTHPQCLNVMTDEWVKPVWSSEDERQEERKISFHCDRLTDELMKHKVRCWVVWQLNSFRRKAIINLSNYLSNCSTCLLRIKMKPVEILGCLIIIIMMIRCQRTFSRKHFQVCEIKRINTVFLAGVRQGQIKPLRSVRDAKKIHFKSGEKLINKDWKKLKN